MSDVLYALADNVPVWRPFAVVILCGVVFAGLALAWSLYSDE